jgi:hypothetical protein
MFTDLLESARRIWWKLLLIFEECKFYRGRGCYSSNKPNGDNLNELLGWTLVSSNEFWVELMISGVRDRDGDGNGDGGGDRDDGDSVKL